LNEVDGVGRIAPENRPFHLSEKLTAAAGCDLKKRRDVGINPARLAAARSLTFFVPLLRH
jgi:hypothetical protein